MQLELGKIQLVTDTMQELWQGSPSMRLQLSHLHEPLLLLVFDIPWHMLSDC